MSALSAANRKPQIQSAKVVLVKIDKGTSVTLTDAGEKMAKAIVEGGEALKDEVLFLSEVAPKMTDALMKRVWRLEDLL